MIGMREYIMSIIGAAVLAFFTNLAAEPSSRQYIKTITGILVAAAIIAPFAQIFNADILSSFEIPDNVTEELSDTSDEYIREQLAAELRREVGADATARLSAEFGIDAGVTAAIEQNAEGQIERVTGLTIDCAEPSNAAGIRARFGEVYGLESREVVFIGR